MYQLQRDAKRTTPERRLGIILLILLSLTGCSTPGVQPAEPAAPAAQETPIPFQELAIQSPEQARDAAIARIAEENPGLILPPGDWQETEETPPGLVGSNRISYRSGDWIVGVRSPVVRPDLVVYDVAVMDKLSGFLWRGKVNAADGTIQAES